jgi:hypothetical protein
MIKFMNDLITQIIGSYNLLNFHARLDYTNY